MHKIGYKYATWKRVSILMDMNEKMWLIIQSWILFQNARTVWKIKILWWQIYGNFVWSRTGGKQKRNYLDHSWWVCILCEWWWGKGLEWQIRPSRSPQKGKRRSIMCSELLCMCHGHLSLTNSDGLWTEVGTTLAIGKGNEEFWSVKMHDVEQVQTKMFPAFEKMHPNCTARIVFDQSTTTALMHQMHWLFQKWISKRVASKDY